MAKTVTVARFRAEPTWGRALEETSRRMVRLRRAQAEAQARRRTARRRR